MQCISWYTYLCQIAWILLDNKYCRAGSKRKANCRHMFVAAIIIRELGTQITTHFAMFDWRKCGNSLSKSQVIYFNISASVWSGIDTENMYCVLYLSDKTHGASMYCLTPYENHMFYSDIPLSIQIWKPSGCVRRTQGELWLSIWRMCGFLRLLLYRLFFGNFDLYVWKT